MAEQMILTMSSKEGEYVDTHACILWTIVSVSGCGIGLILSMVVKIYTCERLSLYDS